MISSYDVMHTSRVSASPAGENFGVSWYLGRFTFTGWDEAAAATICLHPNMSCWLPPLGAGLPPPGVNERTATPVGGQAESSAPVAVYVLPVRSRRALQRQVACSRHSSFRA